jgi:arginyl-tRNA synthetase
MLPNMDFPNNGFSRPSDDARTPSGAASTRNLGFRFHQDEACRMTAGILGAGDLNIFETVLTRVKAACDACAAAGAMPSGLEYSRLVVEPPRDPSHGDMATNAAMVLAKDAGEPPRKLADAIVDRLRADDLVAKAEVAGPGFINISLKPAAWFGALRAAIDAGADYGRSRLGADTAINVEYVSANPTGPMHVGHTRGAVFGDALANLLAFSGYAVTREFYTNDAGAQVDVLARSAYLRYREALGEKIEIPEGLYPGDYLKECGAELASDYGTELKDKPEEEWLPIVRERAINMMVAEIRNDLMALGVVHDVFFSERSLTEGELNIDMLFADGGLVEQASPAFAAEPVDQVAAMIEQLRAAGYVYEGRLPPPKGASVEDWEDREQTLFRSSQFGDDVDRPLKKSDGSYTYFASDIAYHKNKIGRGFLSMIDVWGADHGGYVKRMQAAVNAISDGKADLDVKLIQLVRLLRNGEPVKMSKRAGDIVLSREVVTEVGRDAVRFMMLYRKNDALLDFDLVKVVEQSRENPVFYVQYGHARAQSIFRNAREVLPDLPADPKVRQAMLAAADLERLDDAAELALIRRIAQFPRLIEAAATAHEPHRVAFYLYELASDFHAQWTRGTGSPHLRFIIQNDPRLTEARLALVQGVVNVLAAGLAVLGVNAPEEMR